MGRIIYKTTEGKRVPGVTTIIGSNLGWNKRVLMNWANRMGLQGVDSNKYTDDKAQIGTLAHKMIMDYLMGNTTDTSDYSKNTIDKAENAVLSFLEWEKGHKLEPIALEKSLVSDTLLYGGTSDYIGKVNGSIELIDFKTGSGIYDEAVIQVSAYTHLILECDVVERIQGVRILNIPRSEDESFVERMVSVEELDITWDIFKSCLDLHNLKKKMNKKNDR